MNPQNNTNPLTPRNVIQNPMIQNPSLRMNSMSPFSNYSYRPFSKGFGQAGIQPNNTNTQINQMITNRLDQMG